VGARAERLNPLLPFQHRTGVSETGAVRAPGGRQARVVRHATASDLPGVLIRLYELGHDLDWAVLNPPGAVASIPLLPWSRERPAHLPASGHAGTVPQEVVA
ncbi:hypothetical protein ACWCSH_41060, partial [Streptosporangium sp. NPDC001682]